MRRPSTTTLRTMLKPVALLFCLALVMSSCTDDEPAGPEITEAPGTTASSVEEGGTQSQPLGASSFFAIDEIGVGPDGYVSLTNFTDVPVTTAGLFLCQRPAYIELPDVVVEPGATARIALGNGDGLENVIVTNAELGELRPDDGEIALYTSNDFGNSDAMIVYVEWGLTPHGRTGVAIEAGLWPDGSFAPTASTATRLYKDETSGLWLFEPNE